MTTGIAIPVLTPYKFYAATGEFYFFDNGVNFQNVDNTELPEQDWSGVYPNTWIQPVPRFWNDYTPGIDFQFIVEGAQTFNDTTVTLDDLDGNTVDTLILDNFYTINPEIQARAYMTEMRMDDGCYRLVIRVQDRPIFYSEVIKIGDTHEDCYPLEYSNFENDFGLIFDNGAGDTWSGKLLFPLRIYKPTPIDERETYNNDVGVLTTLRSIPKRQYELESKPVATWFSEKILMIFGCSDLILNKVAVNTEEGLTSEEVNETDKMEIVGNVQLTDFTEDIYTQDEALNLVTELITSWSNVSFTSFATSDTYFAATKETAGFGSANSNTFFTTLDQWYLIDITIQDDIVDGTVNFDGDDYDLETGRNVIVHKSSVTGSDDLTISGDNGSDFNVTGSVKKIT
jgi:hypothetical protein